MRRELLPRAEREGVTYLPGRYFAVSRPQPNGLRISFAGMTPEQIRSGSPFSAVFSKKSWSACGRIRRSRKLPAMV